MPTHLDKFHIEIAKECARQVDQKGSIYIKTVIDEFANGGMLGSFIDTGDIEDHLAIAGIASTEGKYEYHIVENRLVFLRRNMNYDLSESVKRTNMSIKHLNEVIIPKAYEDQNKATRRSLLLAFVSVLFILASLIHQVFIDKQEKELKAIKEQFEYLNKEIQQTNRSIQDLNSSVLKMKTDTLKK